MKKLKINIISKAEMQKKELDLLKGGCDGCCGCSCQYEGSGGGSSIAENGKANSNNEGGGLHTPGGNCCFREYSSGIYGYSASYLSNQH